MSEIVVCKLGLLYWCPIMLCTKLCFKTTMFDLPTQKCPVCRHTRKFDCVLSVQDLQHKCLTMSTFYFEPDPLWYIANNELCSRRLYQREWLVLKRLLREGESISEEQHLFCSVFCPNILGCGFAANKQLTELQMEKIVHFNCCQTHNSLTVWRLEYDKNNFLGHH